MKGAVFAALCLLLVTSCGKLMNQVRHRSPHYVSIGKILAQPRMTKEPLPVLDNLGQLDFYGTQLMIIESGELRHRALDRMRGLHPELKESDVEVHGERLNGSAIFATIATGEDPKYTHAFLDALLDEFISFQKEMREKADGDAIPRTLDDVLAHQKAYKEARTKWFDAKDRNAPAEELIALQTARDQAKTLYDDLKKSFEKMDFMPLQASNRDNFAVIERSSEPALER